MEKNARQPWVAILRQVSLLVFAAAAIGLTVNALSPGGLSLFTAAAPVKAVPTEPGGDILQSPARAPAEKGAAVSADAASAAAPGPAVQVPSYRYEFDPVVEGIDVEHAFIVRNRGTQVLRINQVKPG